MINQQIVNIKLIDMTNLEKENRVMASVELLSEMEALEIHGGRGGDVYNPDGKIQIFCEGAYCSQCNCQVEPKTSAECVELQFYCGDGTTCG